MLAYCSTCSDVISTCDSAEPVIVHLALALAQRRVTKGFPGLQGCGAGAVGKPLQPANYRRLEPDWTGDNFLFSFRNAPLCFGNLLADDVIVMSLVTPSC